MDSFDQSNCCILDFTYVPCVDDKKPVCEDKGCRPVSSTTGFSNASPSSFDIDPVRQPTNLVNHGCVNVPDKHGKDTFYNQFFISHCTTVSLTDLISSFHLIMTSQQNIDGVEWYTEPDCGGPSSIQKNTASCYYGRLGDGIRSFKILTLPGLKSKREYRLGGALLNECDPFSTVAYLSQGNKASVTPAGDCFNKQTSAYILGCKIGGSEASAGALGRQGINNHKRALEPSKSTSRRLHPDMRTWTGPVTTETRTVLETVNGIAMKLTETLKGPAHISSTSAGVVNRGKFTTTKVTAPAASVGVAATVSF